MPLRSTTFVLDESNTVATGSYSMTRRATPLEVALDASALAAPVAAALASVIADQIRSIGAVVAPATVVFRQKAAKAFERGAAWALSRYGDRKPGTSDRLFNDSGELADDVQVDQSGDAFEISLPGDRLSAAGGGDLSGRLESYVPALDDPFADDRMDAALEQTLDVMFGR